MPAVIIPAAPQQDPPDIRMTNRPFVAPVTDSKQTNVNTLAGFAAGSKWACDFYLQELRADTAPAAVVMGDLPVTSQLREVRGFELLINSPVSYQQNASAERGFSATGTGLVYPVLTPNEGDFFLADIGSGRNAVFQVTRSTRDTIHPESMTTIEFKSVKLLTPELLATIKKKVIASSIFSRDLMRDGLNALIKESDVDYLKRLGAVYSRLTNLYVHEFFDTETRTLIVPGQGMKTYDPYMVRFVRRILDQRLCRKLDDVLELGTDHNPRASIPTVLDVIERMDINLLYSASRQAGLTSIQDFKAHPYYFTIAFSGVRQVLITYGEGWSQDLYDQPAVVGARLAKAGVKGASHERLLPFLQTGVAEPRPEVGSFIHRVTQDHHYIFSEAFYNNTEGQSALETLVRSRLEQKPIDLRLFTELAEYADRFDNLERFYYVPIILALIRVIPGVL